MSDFINMGSPPISSQSEIGSPGQPTLAEWKAEIKSDLEVALGKINQLSAADQQPYRHLISIIQAATLS